MIKQFRKIIKSPKEEGREKKEAKTVTPQEKETLWNFDNSVSFSYQDQLPTHLGTR